MPSGAPNPSSPRRRVIIPHILTKTNIPITPQINIFLLSLTSFSLPEAFINLATPQTNTKKHTAPKKGIILKPILINKSITSPKVLMNLYLS